jgi:hypothetical protein
MSIYFAHYFYSFIANYTRIKHTKRVSSISITLSQTPLDSNALGYQAPLASPEHGKVFTRPRPQFQQGGMRMELNYF